MKLIVGLWNPWEKYTYTRHNMGFLLLDKIQTSAAENWYGHCSDWKYESKFLADISKWEIHWEKILLVKPQTFMNLSGESLQKICNFYKLSAQDFIILYDDIDMEFWKIRVRDTWSAWWHNGIKDIIKYFWKDWRRIKIWVGQDDRYETYDWVLSKFREEELIDIDNEIYTAIVQELKKN